MPTNRAKNPGYWLERLSRKRTGFPAATLAYYGPDGSRASKAVLGLLPSAQTSSPTEMRKWFSDTADLRTDAATHLEMLQFLDERGVQRIITVDRLLGCPHEEGIDYPEGEVCPQCPYWADRDRFTGKPLRQTSAAEAGSPRCGLCGKRGKLTRTECCGNWICDDEASYVPFSYAHNSCSRNHDRYTLCSSHHHEGHAGDWKTCEQCKRGFETEMYVYYGTNEYNFERLPNPPAYEPTRCRACGRVIRLADGGYMQDIDGYKCLNCSKVPPEITGLAQRRRKN